jgi:predicted dehydrogenase/threonine dehydrogenase-like Zn-dependent dehydrogenase
VKQVLIRHGGVVVQEVAAPMAGDGEVLIRLAHSCISVGTEMSGVRTSNLPLWKRALQRPQELRKVIDRVRSHGLSETRAMVKSKLEEAYPIGYSGTGTVIAVGSGVIDLHVGDRVACGGSQSAFHAEVVSVPRNLVVALPEAVPSSDAAAVTLAAIALQGVRRAAPTLGESFVVIGLGLLGQLAQQILRASGIRVIGVDLDRQRLDLARQLGMAVGLHPDDNNVVDQVHRLTDGYGADGVIIAAAAPGNDIVATAFQCCRRKGRVVLVGDVGLDINRADVYAKELDFLVSTSYGPGRYDRNYEEGGLDYPLPYIRWTENRNMQECLRLMGDGYLRIAPLVAETFPVERATEAYARLQTGSDKPLALLISYPSDDRPVSRRVEHIWSVPARTGPIRLAVVGAGGFARGTLLPIISDMRDAFSLTHVVNRQGHSAMNVARQFGARWSGTDVEAVLTDSQVDAVMITTRHHLHGPLVLAALRAGKHVFVEKPLCLSRADLDAIASHFESVGDNPPILMAGFNRRFSPYADALKRATATRSSGMIMNYRVNAGYIPADSWVHGQEGGGRNLGEACHFYDLFTFLTGHRVVDVHAHGLRPKSAHYLGTDNFVASMTFDDGSVASLTYTAMGATGHPKERLDVYVDGQVLSLDDYKSFSVAGQATVNAFETKHMEKGHREELSAFAKAIQEGGDWPIPLWQQLQATRIALDVETMLGGALNG